MAAWIDRWLLDYINKCLGLASGRRLRHDQQESGVLRCAATRGLLGCSEGGLGLLRRALCFRLPLIVTLFLCHNRKHRNQRARLRERVLSRVDLLGRRVYFLPLPGGVEVVGGLSQRERGGRREWCVSATRGTICASEKREPSETRGGTTVGEQQANAWKVAGGGTGYPP